MKLLTQIKIAKAVPQADLYRDFFAYLLLNHPTSNTGCLTVAIEARSLSFGGDCVPFICATLNTQIRVFAGKPQWPCTTTEVLRILAHEYRHALQFDLMENVLTKSDYSQAREDDADAFAAQVVPEFISKYNLDRAA